MNKNQCCPASIGGIFFLVNLDTFAYSNQLRTDSLQFFLGLAQKTSNSLLTAQTRHRKMHFRSQRSQLPRPPGHLQRPLTRPYSTSIHQGDSPSTPNPRRLQRKFAHSWASPGTTGILSRILPLLPGLSTLSPETMWSSIGVQNAKTPSTASKLSSTPAPSPLSRTSACRSGYIPTPPLLASEQSSHKYEKARSALFAVPRAPSTKRRKPTPPQNWSASPSSGPLPNSAPT